MQTYFYRWVSGQVFLLTEGTIARRNLSSGFAHSCVTTWAFPGGASGKEPAWQCRCWFDLWVGKVPWRRAWPPTPVFLPGESPWTEEPDGLQSMGSQRIGCIWATKTTHLHEILILQVKTIFVYVLSVCASICKKYICTPLWNEKIFAPLWLIPLSPLHSECILCQYKEIPIVKTYSHA